MTHFALTPRNTLLGRLLRFPLRFIARDQVMTVRAGLNRGLKWIAGASTHGCWIGTYEHDKQQLVAGLVRPGMKAFDIGANAGFYTLAFSRLVGESGHVWAFEPFAENVANLLDHLRINNLSNVTVFQAAVADRAGIAGFQVRESNSMGALSAAVEQYRVPTLSLDALVREGAIPLPDLVKMDVEGAEGLVLKGAPELLSHRRTTWLIALHGDEQAAMCARILRDNGYDIRTMAGAPVAGPIAVDEIYAVPGSA